MTVSISIAVGLLIIRKYFQYGDPLFAFVGLAWTGVYQPWYPSAAVFVLNIAGLVSGGISPAAYLLLGNILLPVTFVAWFWGVTEILAGSDISRRLVVGFYAAVTISMDVVIVIFGTVDPSLLAHTGVVNADFEPLMIVYLLFLAASIAGSGALMGAESLRSSSEPRIRWKGRFLIAASICYAAVALLDVGLIDFLPQLLFFTRTVMILSSLLFYFGFFFPKTLEKALVGKCK